MKAKKWLTIMTFSCSIASLSVALIIGNNSNSIFYDISLAVFGSAMLGFIMSLIEYFTQRQVAMEAFWYEALMALNVLRKYKPINVDAPTSLIESCFQEEWFNDQASKFNGKLENKHMMALVDWYANNHEQTIMLDEGEIYKEELINRYKNQMEKYKQEYQKCIDSCMLVGQMDINPLMNAYGNLDFICNNRSIRQLAYEKIYKAIRKFYELSYENLYHFIILQEGKGSFPACAQIAREICQRVFTEEIIEHNEIQFRNVYQKWFDDIDEELEKFRCHIYFKPQENKPHRTPIFSTTDIHGFGIKEEIDEESVEC